MSKEETQLPGISRRGFLSVVTITCGALVGAAMTVPSIVFVVAEWFRPYKEIWRRVGTVDEFPVGTITAVRFKNSNYKSWSGVSGMTAAYVRRVNLGEFQAFSINCTHLGCPLRWEPNARLFMCPCHGGVFYETGKVAAGPPPKPLRQYDIRVVNNKAVEIKTAPLPLM